MDISQNSKTGEITAGSNVSYWIDSVDPLVFKPLDMDLHCDVVIVGGGISGITTAYCLSRIGKKVVVVEDGNVGSGETGRTTAHLTAALDDRYYSLERMFGENGTRLIAESHNTAVNFIEETVQREKIDCDFKRVDGYLMLHPSDKKDAIFREYKAARKAGLNVSKTNEVPGINYAGEALKFSNQAQFHPLKYLKGLCKAIEANGGMIFTNTHAKSINAREVVAENGFKVNAGHVVVATNSPVNIKYTVHLKEYPFRTYVIGAKVKKDSIPHALWWDTGNHMISSSIPPYHYVRIHPFNDEYDLLISGGEDHSTGLVDGNNKTEESRYDILKRWTSERFKIEDIVYKWSGQVLEPMDSLAYIGKILSRKDNMYMITGDSGNGMTHGTLAGILITDLINGQPNAWEELYNPSRFKIFSAGRTFLKEVIGHTLTYYKSKPHDLDSDHIDKLKSNEAKIIELKGKKHGAYRDENDIIHIVSAECMHLGCIVKWNNSEKTWDCPCHGSRYTYEGKVINGPANKNLTYHSMENLELAAE